MKRSVLFLGTLAFLTLLAGCGSNSLPPSDISNQPSEVQEYEARRTTEREKKINPQGKPNVSPTSSERGR